ncbi:MAG: phosphomannose isomerase type II C-terminal cupin domain [Elusimicrobiota bacterium]|jgi:mannose-6-phosphate isomerase-like protein (cupin superfamily)
MNMHKTDAERPDNVRPWGHWEVILESPSHKVKRITVRPGGRLSYQKHSRRSEHWFIAEGRALAMLEKKSLTLEAGDSIDIPVGAPHRIANEGNSDLVIIEIALGTYFGEDDIVRMEDDYGRA